MIALPTTPKQRPSLWQPLQPTVRASKRYTITDTLGIGPNGPPGSTVTFDGATFTLVNPAVAAATQQRLDRSRRSTSGSTTRPERSRRSRRHRQPVGRSSVSFTDGTDVPGPSTAAAIASANGSVGTAPTQGNAIVRRRRLRVLRSKWPVHQHFVDRKRTRGRRCVRHRRQLETPDVPTSTRPVPRRRSFQGNLLDGNAVGQERRQQRASCRRRAPSHWASGRTPALEGAYGANVLTQNGYAAGTLTNITIGDGRYGQRLVHQRPEQDDRAARGRALPKRGRPLAGRQQPVRGDGQLRTWPKSESANSGVFGAIQSGALEQSNVNLATEFTNLIVAQRAFEANTRGITTADQNLETVINLRA